MNLRPSGYEPDELPGCSTPRCGVRSVVFSLSPLLKEKAGARDGSRTRDFQLGRLTLYQLSYSRENNKDYSITTLLVKWVVQEMFGVSFKESIIT